MAITGASGHLGRAVLRAALDAGWRCRCLSRQPQAPREHVEWVRGDVTDPHAVKSLLSGTSVVIHLAAGTHGPATAMVAASVAGTVTMLDAVACHDIPLVYVSSLSVLAPDADEPYDETTRIDPHPEWRGTYALGKIQAELAVQAHAAARRTTIVRPGQLVSGGPQPLPPSIGFDVGRLRVLSGSRDGIIPAVHVEDAADALVWLADHRRDGETLHLVDPLPCSRGQLSGVLWTPRNGPAHLEVSLGGVLPLIAMVLRWIPMDVARKIRHKLLALSGSHSWRTTQGDRLAWQPHRLRGWLAREVP